ncbi:MAG: PIN domain-containing protein [Nitrospirae bacterium]|nr:MAG: PIN domain-containing protein [Nitrospirota bacterium]
MAKITMLLIFILSGVLYGLHQGYIVQGILIGCLLGVLAILIKLRLKQISIGSIIGGLVGLAAGIVTANLLLLPFRYIIPEPSWPAYFFVLNAIFGYGGLFVGVERGRSFTIPSIMRLFKGQETETGLKLLDTSVIIDGRIADILEVGFIEGTLVIPQFILHELQYVADSPDPMRRAKGRRGLDMLQRIQKMAGIDVRIVEEDFPKIKEVDSKLVALARVMNAKIITNDFNLNKVAQLQGVAILNINELSNVLKPVVLPGEAMTLFVVKEGKEHNQGVAYLDDGTMVVVENARRLIGRSVIVTVTSVLQTTAGRMIFAKPKDDD